MSDNLDNNMRVVHSTLGTSDKLENKTKIRIKLTFHYPIQMREKIERREGGGDMKNVERYDSDLEAVINNISCQR